MIKFLLLLVEIHRPMFHVSLVPAYSGRFRPNFNRFK